MTSRTKIPTLHLLTWEAQQLPPEAQVLVDLCVIRLRAQARCPESRAMVVRLPDGCKVISACSAAAAFREQGWTVDIESDRCEHPRRLVFTKASTVSPSTPTKEAESASSQPESSKDVPVGWSTDPSH